jgi:osmotically-inducible protein OsmY
MRLLLAGAFGALIAFFFDRDNGRRRRAVTRDRVAAIFRSTGRRTERLARGVAVTAEAAQQKVAHLREEEKPQPDDVTLARKVETEIFRDPDVPKGQINVNAEEGVVVLRGEVQTPEMIRDLIARTRQVQGVRDVESLLHLPNTPAPTHQ